MKRRAPGKTIENEATLSKPKETGRSGWEESQASAPESDSIHSEITEQLLGGLRRPQDGINPNLNVNIARYRQNTDSSVFASEPPYLVDPPFNDANIQDQEFGFENYTVQQTFEEGSQRVLDYRHTFQATASQASSAAPVALTPADVYFYPQTQQNPQGQHMTYNFAGGPANYQQPGPVLLPQRTMDQDYGNQHFSYMDLWSSSMMPEATPAFEATPVPGATPVPEVIHTTNTPKRQKGKKKVEERVPPTVNINNNDNNPAPVAHEGRWCPWPDCRRKKPFSKGHNLIQHRRDVHKEDIPILKYRFGRPPPGDSTRRVQQRGKRGAEKAGAAGGG